MSACPHGDPRCPCRDGDPCHYAGPNPLRCPRTGVIGCEACPRPGSNLPARRPAGDGLDSVRDVLQEYAAAFGQRVNLTVFDRGTGEVTRVEATPPGVNIDADTDTDTDERTAR